MYIVRTKLGSHREIILHSIPRVPVCPLSLRPNWPPPLPLSHKQVCPPPPIGTKVVGNTGLRVRGGAHSDDWRESLALCILCAGS
jgi:hypothetical protein